MKGETLTWWATVIYAASMACLTILMQTPLRAAAGVVYCGALTVGGLVGFAVRRLMLPPWCIIIPLAWLPSLGSVTGHSGGIHVVPGVFLVAALALAGSPSKAGDTRLITSLAGAILTLFFGSFVVVAHRELRDYGITPWALMMPVNSRMMPVSELIRRLAQEHLRVSAGLLVALWGSARLKAIAWPKVTLTIVGLTAWPNIIMAAYQGFINITVLNSPFWIRYRRATGFLQDGNMLGLLMAATVVLSLWLLHLGLTRPRQWFSAITAGSALVALGLSGSRTGLLGLIVVGLMTLITAGRRQGRARGQEAAPNQVRRAAAGIGITVGIIVFLVTIGLRTGYKFPLVDRLIHHGTVPWARSQQESKPLWQRVLSTRERYWRVAGSFLAHGGVLGTGPGAYEIYAIDEAVKRYGRLNLDSALNWYLQQYLEVGPLGIVFYLLCLSAVLRPWRPAHALITASIIGWAAVLVFIPPQHLALSSLAWFVGTVILIPRLNRSLRPRFKFALMALAVLTVIQLHSSSHYLAPSQRAYRYGWSRAGYGLYYPETWPGRGAFRWTRPRFGLVVPTDHAGCVVLEGWTGRPAVEGPVLLRGGHRANSPLTTVSLDPRMGGFTAAFPLAPGTRRGQVFHFIVQPPWRPGRGRKQDVRILGVALSTVRWLASCPRRD